MVLVIATFIITAVFVGYHASQEYSEKIAEVHSLSTELKAINIQLEQSSQYPLLI